MSTRGGGSGGCRPAAGERGGAGGGTATGESESATSSLREVIYGVSWASFGPCLAGEIASSRAAICCFLSPEARRAAIW